MISGDAAAVDSLVSGGEGQTVISQYPQVTPPEAGVPAAQSVPEVSPLTFYICLPSDICQIRFKIDGRQINDSSYWTLSFVPSSELHNSSRSRLIVKESVCKGTFTDLDITPYTILSPHEL